MPRSGFRPRPRARPRRATRPHRGVREWAAPSRGQSTCGARRYSESGEARSPPLAEAGLAGRERSRAESAREPPWEGAPRGKPAVFPRERREAGHRPAERRRSATIPAPSAAQTREDVRASPVRPSSFRRPTRRNSKRNDEEARTGFEPVYGEKAHGERDSREPEPASAPELPAELQRAVERVTRAARAGARESSD